MGAWGGKLNGWGKRARGPYNCPERLRDADRRALRALELQPFAPLHELAVQSGGTPSGLQSALALGELRIQLSETCTQQRRCPEMRRARVSAPAESGK